MYVLTTFFAETGQEQPKSVPLFRDRTIGVPKVLPVLRPRPEEYPPLADESIILAKRKIPFLPVHAEPVKVAARPEKSYRTLFIDKNVDCE
jgi:hypothetical protein